MRLPFAAAALLLCAAATSTFAADAAILVDAGTPGIKVSPTLYGIFFEEINRSGEGGIYAEKVLNRSF